MNDDYEAKMFALSALKTVSASIAGTNVSYRTDMGLDELGAAAGQAGFGAFSGYLSHALYSIGQDPGVDYSIPFVMSLQQQKIIIKLDFVVESRSLDITVIVREVIIKGETRPFSGIRSATFGATVFENTGETTEVLLTYDGGRYE